MQDPTKATLSSADQAEAVAAVGKVDFDAEVVDDCDALGIGAGVKEVGGVKTGEPAVVIFVDEKRDRSERYAAPPELGGMQTDVQEVGRIVSGPAWLRSLPPTGTDHGPQVLAFRKAARRRARDAGALQTAMLGIIDDLIELLCGEVPQPRTGKFRPCPLGVSVAHVDVTAGTAGLWVEDTGTGEVFLLSNNHVLANSNAATIGDPIVQPGPYDGGSDGVDNLNQLAGFEPIDFGAGGNLFDAAIAGDQDPADVDLEVLEVGPCQGYRQPADLVVGQAVQKSGRTTGLAHGTINAVSVSVRVNYGNGREARFDNQLQITGGQFSQGGDSGSAILDDDAYAVGLLFAGSDFVTIASHMAPILEGGLGRTLKVHGT